MPKHRFPITTMLLLLLTVPLLLAGGCINATETPLANTPVQGDSRNKPEILSSSLDKTSLGRYESLEITVDLNANYDNPYDLRQVSMEAEFKGPQGARMDVPGFWDGTDSWKVRFTPYQEGEWSYTLSVEDQEGKSQPFKGEDFLVTPSDRHGWLQPGNQVDKKWSGHYLVYHDGTPFYGLGYCEALNILIDGFSIENGVGLFNDMLASGQNYVVWWPFYTNSLVSGSYDDYSTPNMNVIDMVVADAQAKNIFLVFTIWDHPNLRDDTHAWGRGNWFANGFSKLGPINAFFTDDEMWAWQENLYRYIIARWGYSPAIGLWQTVSEINGTNAYAQKNSWHQRINDFFVENDPFRHPTTASQSGGGNDIPWPQGHAVMDMPQVHIYDPLNNNPVGAAEVMARWTSTMWEAGDKPNWVGEFGVTGNNYYPELFHNSIWAALASGAALTPAEWNSGGAFGRMTPEMLADLQRLGDFVSEMPLAEWDPAPIRISTTDKHVRAWGLAGEKGGLAWVQDFSMQGMDMESIRAYTTPRTGVQLKIDGLSPGDHTITPFDPWTGEWQQPFTITCQSDTDCSIALPDFLWDLAFLIQ